MSKKVPMKEKASIFVIKIVPNHIQQPVTGLVVGLSGFWMERCLSNVMYPCSPNDSKKKVFLRDTGACDLCFEAKIGCFLVKAVLVPMEASEMSTDKEVRTYINSTFIPALYNATHEGDNLGVEQVQLPLLKDKKQIISVINWGDAIHRQEDIVMLVHMVLKLKNVSFYDWIHCEESNIYSLFEAGNIAPYTIARFNISFEKLSLEDKINYAAFLVEQKRVNLRHDVTFLDNIRGKTSLTPIEQSNFENILREYNTR